MSESFASVFYAFQCVLSSCRRVFLLLLLLLVMAVAWVSWTLPDLDRLRPEIEASLRNQLSLKSLSLGRLSWRWRGDLEIHAARLDLLSADARISLQGAEISLVVSIGQLAQGIWLPDQIYIRNGLLKVAFSDHVDDEKIAQQAHSAPWFDSKSSTLIAYENMTLLWQYKQYHRILHHAKGFFSMAQRSVELFSDELNISLMLDDDKQVKMIKASVDRLHLFLQQRVGVQLSPDISAELLLRRKANNKWQVFVSATSATGLLTLPLASFQLPFDQLDIEGEIEGESLWTPSRWSSINFSKLFWQHGKQRIVATAKWEKGMLSLHAKSPYLKMPLLWSWLRPINNDTAWHDWLSSMHDGTAKNTRADITLPWLKPWHKLPAALNNGAFRYHVRSNLSDVDVYLGKKNEFLLHTEASIDLNQDGLHANIKQTTLPNAIGLAYGQLHIPWDTLILNIKAKTKNVDMMRLHRWVDPDGAKELGWQYGKAKGNVDLLWNPVKADPEWAIASLSPITPWLLYIQDQKVTVNAGTIVWQKNKGITGKSVTVETDMLHGTVNFDAKIKNKSWRLGQFSGDFAIPLTRIVTAYHIPITQPSGQFKAHLAFDGDWRGSIILNAAAWDNFLGESKKIGQAMRIGFTAHSLEESGIQINEVVCRDAGFQLRGRGHVNTQGISIELEQIKTRGFRGRLSIVGPRGDKPWRMIVDADYLRRSALPTSIPSRKKEKVDKNWQLKAHIRTFDWQDARMHNIQLTMQSKPLSLGRFSAEIINLGSMALRDVGVRFKMLGKGKIEVGSLSASMNEQSLQLTATLSPLPDGSMRWQGFATTEGDFSRMMRNKAMTKMFSGGKDQILFAGEGVLMRNQPWWQGLRGRLRLRVDEGSIAKGGLLTKLLAITSIADLPALLIGQRKDLTHAGLFYERLQIEATLNNQNLHIHQLAMRSTAMDMAGYGRYNLDKKTIDLTMVFRPLQNLDAILDKIPLLRDLIGGAAHSFIRKVYHMHGAIGNATIEQVTPASAGLPNAGIIEGLLTLPDRWFGGMKTKKSVSDYEKRQ
ncbi:MAG: AsmA-like C-terminal domain-containing protein [Mariprofundaceae bacterium]|nr:AsmA-like C-terminal domain-containing protein [Mariprofundaceae bacterium]